MTPATQLFPHRPDEGVFGDCYRTAIACLLDLPPEDVPHHHRVLEGNEQRALMDEWLEPRGLRLVLFAWPCQVTDILEVMGVVNPDAHYLVSGQSPRGTDHTVVAKGGEIIHDPHPEGGGLVGPCSDGHCWIELLVRR